MRGCAAPPHPGIYRVPPREISLPYTWIHLVSVIRQQSFPSQSPRLNFLNIYLSAQLYYSMVFFSVPQAYPFSSPCEHYSAGCWSDCWFTVWFRWSCLSFDCWTLWQGKNLPQSLWYCIILFYVKLFWYMQVVSIKTNNYNKQWNCVTISITEV